MTRAQRMLKIYSRISERETLSPAVLAGELGVSERTVYRDLRSLAETLDVPIYFEDGYKLLEKPQTLLQLLTPEEKAAMKILSKADGDLLRTEIGQTLKSAAKKLLSINGRHLAGLNESVLGQLEGAISERCELKVMYRSLGEAAFRGIIVQPLALFVRRSAWYAAAFSLEHNEVRTYRVERMSSIRPTGFQFVPPSGFSLQDYLGNSFDIETGEITEVELRLTRKAAQSLMERHTSAVMDWVEDAESGEVCCRLRVAGTAEIQRWVMQWSGEAEVESPAALREQIALAARRVAARHKRESGRRGGK